MAESSSTRSPETGDSVTQRDSSEPRDSETVVWSSNSYSGPDMKLIVHMRGESTSDPETESLRAELETLLREGTESDPAVVAERVAALEEMMAARGSEETETPRRTKVLAEIQTLSITTHREKAQVRPLGTVYPRSITRGPRTIGGSMIFAVFYEHVFAELLETAQYRSTGARDFDRYRDTAYIPDQLPPLDVSISFANEYGNLSWMSLLGVEFINEGLVLSVMDLFTENTYQYIARDYDPLRNVGNRRLPTQGGELGTLVTGTELTRRDLLRRSAGRRNPFI
jgi:hypothetical protein